MVLREPSCYLEVTLIEHSNFRISTASLPKIAHDPHTDIDLAGATVAVVISCIAVTILSLYPPCSLPYALYWAL